MTKIRMKLAQLIGGKAGKLSYAQGRYMLDHPDKAVRCSLAARPDLDCEMLYYLAGDPDADVRLAVANNPSTPGASWLVLADDQSDDVRVALAKRLPALLDRTSRNAEQSVRDVVASLRLLVRDALPEVRRALSTVLREMPDVPSDIVKTLAFDPIEQIAMPIIELSPVLTDDDLLEILNRSTFSGTASTVARRPRLPDAVADALVRTGDSKAIENLLRNHSAQIREDTLDLIVDMAPSQPLWHRPLAVRPGLSATIMRKVAGFVTDEILQVVAERTDMDEGTMAYVRQKVLDRMAQKYASTESEDPVAIATEASALRLAHFRAQSLKLSDKLSREAIMTVIARGLSPLGIAMLAVSADLPISVVAAAVRRGGARPLLAVSWAADLTAHDAVMVQNIYGRTTPDSVIAPGVAGMFGMPEIAMRYALDELSDPSPATAV